LPRIERDGVRLRLIAGNAFGERSPVVTYSVDVLSGCRVFSRQRDRPAVAHVERAVLRNRRRADHRGIDVPLGRLAVLAPGENVESAQMHQRAPSCLAARRWMASASVVELRFQFARAHRRAKAEWKSGKFAPIPGETEFIPLPD